LGVVFPAEPLWQDPDKVWHGLAVLDTEKAINIFKEKIAELDKQSLQWKNEMDQNPDKLTKVKAAMKIFPLIELRAGLNDKLQEYNSGKGVESPFNAAEVKSLSAKLISGLKVVINVSGDGAKHIETGIQRGLQKFGLQGRLVADTQGADIIVEGKIEGGTPNPSEKPHGILEWARTTVFVDLKDAATGQSFSSFEVFYKTASRTSRKGGPGLSEAARRTHVKLGETVAAKVNEAVTAYFQDQ
jgi:hypothetical protein